MTDERLNQILKQALAPEIDDSEIQIRRKERKNKLNMKKIIAGGMVACAALTLVIAGHNTDVFQSDKNVEVASTNVVEKNSPLNLFAITAYAAELPEGVTSGDILGLSNFEAGYGSPLYLGQRFAISGENITKVMISSDKCNIYSVESIYEGDSNFEIAQNEEATGTDDYVMITDVDFDYDEEKATEATPYHYEHIVIEGNQYEASYNKELVFGMSVPEALWDKNTDDQLSYREAVDHVDGAILTIAVTYTDGSMEEHHYRLNTGKIFVPTDENGFNDWDNLTRFLTDEEESAGNIGYTYGYLLEKAD